MTTVTILYVLVDRYDLLLDVVLTEMAFFSSDFYVWGGSCTL